MIHMLQIDGVGDSLYTEVTMRREASLRCVPSTASSSAAAVQQHSRDDAVVQQGRCHRHDAVRVMQTGWCGSRDDGREGAHQGSWNRDDAI